MAVFEDEKAFLRYAAELDLGGVGQGVIPWDGEVEGFLKKLLHDKAGVGDGEAEDGDVEGSVEDLLDKFRRFAFAEVEVDFGVAVGEILEAGGEEIGKDGGYGADAERAADTFASAFEEFGESGGVFEK